MTELIIAFTSLIGVILGTGGILFYKQSKRLKAAEAGMAEKAVIAKELENEKNASDEWIRLYNEAKDELNEAKDELKTVRSRNLELQNKLQSAIEVEGHQRLIINDLEWSRCIVNGCTKRQPPRDFQKKLDKIEHMHDDITKVTEFENDECNDCDGCSVHGCVEEV